MAPEDVCALTLMTVQHVDFKFDGSFNRKIDSVAIGTPLGPILADIFLASLKSTKKKRLINLSLFYVSYVDDTFLLLDHKQDPEAALDELNGLHPRIKFTMERFP